LRKTLTYPVKDPVKFKHQLLEWSRKFSHFCFYDSNTSEGKGYQLVAAVGALEIISPSEDSLGTVTRAHASNNDWLFGYLSYELKNEVEQLDSKNHDGLHFPPALFFRPQFVFELNKTEVKVCFLQETDEEVETMIKAIHKNSYHIPHHKYNVSRLTPHITIKKRIEREQYIETVNKIKEHIRKGDVYEMNFCQEFYSEGSSIDPLEIYLNLNQVSLSPFSAFCRFNDKYLLSSSPERYLKKNGTTLISQPIKGTRSRGMDATADELMKKELEADEKERSENVMIVDLVRNDLSRIAKEGSVKVDEMFKVYTFKQLHQMISTISCELQQGKTFADVIRATFPMGSMTGAPKVKAMQLIEQYESTRRGLYSGAVGYISPTGDFDLSVVIRSILYNASDRYLSFMTGSAITDGSDPEKEYEECLLKAKAMFSVFNNSLN